MTENELMAEKERLEKLIPEYEKKIRMGLDMVYSLTERKYLSKTMGREICRTVVRIKEDAKMLGGLKNRLVSIEKGYDVYDL